MCDNDKPCCNGSCCPEGFCCDDGVCVADCGSCCTCVNGACTYNSGSECCDDSDCTDGKLCHDCKCMVSTDDCWEVSTTSSHRGYCVCYFYLASPTRTECESDDECLQAVGYGQVLEYTRTCTRVASGETGKTECSVTPPAQLVAKYWKCVKGVDYLGAIECYVLNVGICTAVCIYATETCLTYPGTDECATAARDCYYCILEEGVTDCGCLTVKCHYADTCWEARIPDNLAHGDNCIRP